MVSKDYTVGPRKVEKVTRESDERIQTKTSQEFVIDSVIDGTEQDFIDQYRVYDFISYDLEEQDENTVQVTWELGNGTTMIVRYAA